MDEKIFSLIKKLEYPVLNLSEFEQVVSSVPII